MSVLFAVCGSVRTPSRHLGWGWMGSLQGVEYRPHESEGGG